MPDPEAIELTLARIDERTQNLVSSINQLKESCVSQAEFKPVKALVFGGVGLVLMAVVGAVVALVIQGQSP